VREVEHERERERQDYFQECNGRTTYDHFKITFILHTFRNADATSMASLKLRTLRSRKHSAVLRVEELLTGGGRGSRGEEREEEEEEEEEKRRKRIQSLE